MRSISSSRKSACITNSSMSTSIAPQRPDGLGRDHDVINVRVVFGLGDPTAAEIEVDPDRFDLQVIDVSDPTAPSVIATIDNPGAASAVALAGDHLCIADGTAEGLVDAVEVTAQRR